MGCYTGATRDGDTLKTDERYTLVISSCNARGCNGQLGGL